MSLLGKTSLKKKYITFFTLGSDPPPYFPESVAKKTKPKQKTSLLKCNIKGRVQKKNSLEFSIRGGGFLPILGPFPYFFFYF